MKTKSLTLRLCRTILLLTILLPLSSFALNGRMRFITTQDGRYLRLGDLAEQWQLHSENMPNDRIVLADRNYRFELGAGSRGARLNGTLLYLHYPPICAPEGKWFLHQLDMERSLKPYFDTDSLYPDPVRRIILDPGHGGADPGARGETLLEKEINLAVARRVAARLRAAGFEVVMTRDDDSEPTLAERSALVRTTNSDLFVSIHQNAATNRNAIGIETFCVTPPELSNPADSRNNRQNDCPGHRFERNSLRLATGIQSQLLRHTGATDRGVKRARFRVLRMSDCPAVLVECGFISNHEEEQKLGREDYQEQLAEGIASGILQYCRELEEL